MKTVSGVFFAMLMVSATGLSQDLSSFYSISGFRLPALRAGQYALLLTPHYSIRPSDYASVTNSTSATSSPSTSSTTNGNSTTSYYTPYSAFSANTNFTYGISDETTFSLGLSYAPNTTYGTRTTLSSSSTAVVPVSSLTNSLTNGTTNFTEQSLGSTLVVAHRLQPNIELSLTASWSFSKSPYFGSSAGSGLHNSGGVTPTISTTMSSSNDLVSSNAHAFDISATVVIL